jgi:4-amino-4-deoxy-L-arabinose transferase-like glycosyltransferase
MALEPPINITPDQVVTSATPGVSLVLPALNEQEVIQQAIAEADDALRDLVDDYEILVVDDGSSDQTRSLAEAEARQRPHVRVLAHESNRGYGAALRTGFQAATKQWIGFTDSDCQFDLRELGRLLLLMRDGDIACGYRIDRQDSWLRILYSRVYNVLVGLMLGTGVRDCDCALKLFRRDTLQAVMHESNGFLVNAEMLTKARMLDKKVIEVGVSHRPRPRGESTVSVLHTIPVFQSLLRFWWKTVLFPGTRPNPDPQHQTAASWSTGRVMLATGVLSLLAMWMMFCNLNYPLVEPDESRYAQIALEMVNTGDYLVPRLQGEPYLDKPPLLYWVTAASFNVFGQSELAARIPSALAAMLTVLVSFLLGRRLIGDQAAWLGSLMLFLCLGFVLSARFLVMDGPLTLFTTTCLMTALLATRGPRLQLGWWLLAAVSCALGVMTKGPVAIVLTCPPLLALHWLDQRRALPKLKAWLLFAVLVACIVLPWFILIERHQHEFAGHFFWQHHVVRFFSAFNHQEPFWYYIPVLFAGMFPSSLLAAPVLFFLFNRGKEFREMRTPALGGLALAGVWIVLFFSLSSCKLPTYILPAVPMLCMLQACVLSTMLDQNCPHAFLRSAARRLPAHATGLALVAGLTIAIVDLCLNPDRVFGTPLNIFVIVAAGAFLIHRVVRRQQWQPRPANWVVAATVSLMVMAFGFQNFMPAFAEYRSINANAARLQKHSSYGSRPVVYYDWDIDGATFYLPPEGIHRFERKQLEDATAFVMQYPEVVVIADRNQIKQLRQALGDRASVTSVRGARGRLYVATARDSILTSSRPRDSQIH